MPCERFWTELDLKIVFSSYNFYIPGKISSILPIHLREIPAVLTRREHTTILTKFTNISKSLFCIMFMILDSAQAAILLKVKEALHICKTIA